MGLDMYLTRDIYIGAIYDHNKITGKIELYRGGEPLDIDVSKVTVITEEVMYWRKANHIHGWFVRNVQDDVDDCKKYWVSAQNLRELHDVCQKVWKSRKDGTELAEKFLPVSEGFFFGDYEYNDYYYDTVKETMLALRPYINLDGNSRVGDFYYQASW